LIYNFGQEKNKNKKFLKAVILYRFMRFIFSTYNTQIIHTYIHTYRTYVHTEGAAETRLLKKKLHFSCIHFAFKIDSTILFDVCKTLIDILIDTKRTK